MASGMSTCPTHTKPKGGAVSHSVSIQPVGPIFYPAGQRRTIH